MPIKKDKTILFLGFFFCLSQNSFGQEISNIELVTDLVDSLLGQGFAELSPSVRKQARIRSANENQLNWILEDRLKKTLSRMGYGSILTDDGSRDSTTSFQTKAYLFVEYGISKIDVRYEKASKDSVSFMQKVAEVGFFLKVREGDLGPVIYDRFFEGRREVRPESGRFSLGTGQAKKVKNGGRILAPVLISTVTGVIVYLFYALRSR